MMEQSHYQLGLSLFRNSAATSIPDATTHLCYLLSVTSIFLWTWVYGRQHGDTDEAVIDAAGEVISNPGRNDRSTTATILLIVAAIAPFVIRGKTLAQFKRKQHLEAEKQDEYGGSKTSKRSLSFHSALKEYKAKGRRSTRSCSSNLASRHYGSSFGGRCSRCFNKKCSCRRSREWSPISFFDSTTSRVNTVSHQGDKPSSYLNGDFHASTPQRETGVKSENDALLDLTQLLDQSNDEADVYLVVHDTEPQPSSQRREERSKVGEARRRGKRTTIHPHGFTHPRMRVFPPAKPLAASRTHIDSPQRPLKAAKKRPHSVRRHSPVKMNTRAPVEAAADIVGLSEPSRQGLWCGC